MICQWNKKSHEPQGIEPKEGDCTSIAELVVGHSKKFFVCMRCSGDEVIRRMHRARFSDLPNDGVMPNV